MFLVSSFLAHREEMLTACCRSHVGTDQMSDNAIQVLAQGEIPLTEAHMAALVPLFNGTGM
jgi:hypothetical protein